MLGSSSSAWQAAAEAAASAAGISKGWVVSDAAMSKLANALRFALKLSGREKAERSSLTDALKTEQGISSVCGSMGLPYSESMSISFIGSPSREKSVRHGMIMARFDRVEALCRKMLEDGSLYRQKRLGRRQFCDRNDILGAVEVFASRAVEALAA